MTKREVLARIEASGLNRREFAWKLGYTPGTLNLYLSTGKFNKTFIERLNRKFMDTPVGSTADSNVGNNSNVGTPLTTEADRLRRQTAMLTLDTLRLTTQLVEMKINNGDYASVARLSASHFVGGV